MKYVALDIGNVLCSVNFDNFLRCLSRRLNITLDDAMYFLNRSQKLHDLGLTVMKDELRDHLKIKSEPIIEELLHEWNKSITPEPWVLEKYNDLIDSHGLKVALLSNIGTEHAALMEHSLNVGTFFSGAIKHFSCFVGARKPTALFYQSFLLEHPEFYSCLYIDDLQENLDVGKRFGFQTYRFSLDPKDDAGTLTEIEQLIVGA